MSVSKKVELTEKPRHLGGDALAIKVRFNYIVNGEPRSIRKNYTVHAETKEELKEIIRGLYENNNPDSSKVKKSKKLADDLNAEDSIDISE